VSEETCPFCHATLSREFRGSPAPQPPRARLSRAALRAFGTGALAITAACSSSSSGGNLAPAYGAPPFDASSDDGGDSSLPVVDAAYGGPPLDAADDTTDTGSPPMGDAAYGAPPIDSGSPTDGGTD